MTSLSQFDKPSTPLTPISTAQFIPGVNDKKFKSGDGHTIKLGDILYRLDFIDENTPRLMTHKVVELMSDGRVKTEITHTNNNVVQKSITIIDPNYFVADARDILKKYYVDTKYALEHKYPKLLEGFQKIFSEFYPNENIIGIEIGQGLNENQEI